MKARTRMAELLEPTHDLDRFSRTVNLSLILLITLNVIAIFLETVDSIYAEYELAFWYFEVFSVLVFTLEYVARVWSSIDLEDMKDKSPVTGRLKYMLRPIALIDLFAILPFYLGLFFNLDLRFLRVMRMLRLFKITRYSTALSALLDVIQKEADALLASIVVLLMMLVISSGGIYLLEHELQPDTFGSMPGSMWWAIVTLTTVGYGDVVPMTPMGKLFGGVIGLIGIGMIALPAAIMASGFAENINRRRQTYNRSVQRYLKDGIIDETERWKLEELRKDLGLDSDEALQLLDNIVQQAKQSVTANCPHCGKHLADEPERD